MRSLGQFQTFIFFTRKFYSHKKYKKHKTQISNFHSDVFYAHKKHKKYKKHKKAQNVKQAIFFFLDVFYAHKNTVFFVLHTKKHIKSIKTQINEQVTFFPLDIFLSAFKTVFFCFCSLETRIHHLFVGFNKLVKVFFPLRCVF